MTVFWKDEMHETELWLRMAMSEVLKISVYKPTTSENTFSMHVKEQEISAIQAMADIQSQSKLPLETAMKFGFKNTHDFNVWPGNSMAGLFNAAPVIYFPGALFYSAGFNVNQDLKKKIFLNKSMFNFFFIKLP
jgi:hypothetical protein